ncbi:hypothetical protein ASF49_16735 [Methylobacterium sp. Leaf104]|uniref:hypothetical protein n=1 Tax=Methylobacterium TaxID=407 RepID=UPI0006FBADAA|nr:MULTISPECIES: hypothetical protein [Methylobacterium]KQP41548.1 hypothetical protein ASF49_16735 [Methylobacterium sp. Leaf104]MCI9881602.1 hypothetical protein [Methylobacterium goesingense]
MRFSINHDTGDSIRGWIAPDNPLAISRVVVSIGGRRVAEVAASESHEEFVKAGWHSTGQCIFQLTDAEVPGLAMTPRLELYDSDTNVLVYRRLPEDSVLPQRVILLNTSVRQDVGLEAALFPFFRQSYFNLHKLPEDTLSNILGDRILTSCLLSGGVGVPRYEHFFADRGIMTAMLVSDPYVEMATRLLWLQSRSESAADPANRWRYGTLAESAAFTAAYDFTDAKSIKRFLRMLPEPAYRLLYNPLTRQLGIRMPDDNLGPGNSIVAIEVLARIDVIGHASRYDAFVATLFDRIGVEPKVVTPPGVSDRTLALADRLRGVREATEMIVFDRAIAEAVENSVARVWTA